VTLKLVSMLKPNESVAAAMATAGIVYGTYAVGMPSMTEVHGAQAQNNSVESSRKKSMWTSAAIVGAIFLLTKDANVFIVGGATMVVIDWQYRHANAVHPKTGQMVPNAQATNLSQGYTDAPMQSTDVYEG
jgi:hypothetical protein